MAKVVPVLWKHKKTADGRHPLWLRFDDGRRTLYLSLGVSLAARDWNGRSRRVRRSHPNADRVNQLVARRLAEAEDERLRLIAEREPVTAGALKAALAAPAPEAEPCALAYVEAYLAGVERAGNVARVDKERVVVRKLRAFVGGGTSARLPFSALTPAFLRAFEAHLMAPRPDGHGNKASTVHANMNVLRLHVRRAVREGVVGPEADPFVSYSPPKVRRTERAKLSAAEIARLDGLDVGPRGPAGSLDARVLDAFLFALYAAGVRFGDLARLRRSDVSTEPLAEPEGGDGEGPRVAFRLAYTAGKTGKRTATVLVPPAVRIVAPYLASADGAPKPPGAFLLPILDGYDLSTPRDEDRAVASQNALHNKVLKRLAERAKVSATLSMHVARHSFADLARRRGWDSYDIKQALRHSSIAVTERYLAGFDPAALDAKMGGLFGDSPAPGATSDGSDPAKDGA